MTVYKYFLKITWKNKWAIILYIGIFFLTVLLNSNSSNVDTSENQFMDTRLIVGIIDNENSELSGGLSEYLESKNDLVETKGDELYIKEQIFMEHVSAVIIIPKGFDKKVNAQKESVIIYTDERKPESIAIENQINKYLSFANISYENGNYMLDDVHKALNQEVPVHFTDNQDQLSSNANEFAKFYFNIIGYAIIAIYISAIGLVMAELNEKKVVLRRRVSSKRFLNYNMEILLGQLTIAAITTLIFILGFTIWKSEFVNFINFEKYIINISVLSITVLSLTFLITNLTINRNTIMALATVLSLGISFISGVMVPQEFLSENVLNIAKFFPVYYFVKANNTNIISYMDIRNELIMMVLFAVVFLLLGLIVSKKTQTTNTAKVRSEN